MTMTDPHILILALAGILIVAAAVRFYRHQCLLRDRAYLMREAVRNRDFSFRLPVKGLFFGERAMQQALNDMSLDIKALEARKEVESWQRLTRVLTHEIMNAATPICSISQAYLSDPSIKGTPYEEGIIAIHQTGMGMTAFVENYRKLTDLQEAELEEVDLQQTLEILRALYPDVVWHISTNGQLRFKADRGMMLQVLSNLAKNACEAGARDIDIRWDNALLKPPCQFRLQGRTYRVRKRPPCIAPPAPRRKRRALRNAFAPRLPAWRGWGDQIAPAQPARQSP